MWDDNGIVFLSYKNILFVMVAVWIEVFKIKIIILYAEIGKIMWHIDHMHYTMLLITFSSISVGWLECYMPYYFNYLEMLRVFFNNIIDGVQGINILHETESAEQML